MRSAHQGKLQTIDNARVNLLVYDYEIHLQLLALPPRPL